MYVHTHVHMYLVKENILREKNVLKPGDVGLLYASM
jgi:hypothetical protein